MLKIRFHKKIESADCSTIDPSGMWWNYFGIDKTCSNTHKLDLEKFDNDDLIELCSALKSIVDR